MPIACLGEQVGKMPGFLFLHLSFQAQKCPECYTQTYLHLQLRKEEFQSNETGTVPWTQLRFGSLQFSCASLERRRRVLSLKTLWNALTAMHNAAWNS